MQGSSHSDMDVAFMREALRQARKGAGRTSPNPAVGAVIVRDGRIMASGFHRKAGLPHAEVDALNRLGGAAEGATLYVTLEPCNHYGRTPPCTEAIIQGRIRRVVVGMEDPNPRVRGGGCARLRETGIQVTSGVLEKECRRLNEAFVKFVTAHRPFVILKSALTLDGWIATATGHARWVTNERSRQFAHRLRDRVDAVMVGVGTVIADDPELTTRLRGRKGRDPARIVVDTHLRVQEQAKVLRHTSSAHTYLVVSERLDPKRVEALRRPGVSFIFSGTKGGKIDLGALLDILAEKQITSLLVEGGAALAGSMIRERLVDKFYLFLAPKVLGGDDGVPLASGRGARRMDRCVALQDIRVRRFEDDILIEGYPRYPGGE